MTALDRDTSATITVRHSLAPVAGTGSDQNGASIDRQGFLSGAGVVAYSTSGGVTGGTITGRWQDSADGSTGWANYGTTVTVNLTGTNPSGAFEVPANLSSAKRYVRLVVDADPTGGTPASIVAATAVLGGRNVNPA